MKNKVIDMFPGKKIIQNEGKKYSDMLNDFIQPYENDFPIEMDIADIIDFACNAWNLGCMNLILPNNEFKKMLDDNPFPEPENTILKKLIKRKKEKFAKYDRFIEDFSLEENNGQLILTVLTQNKEEFVSNLMDEPLDSILKDEDFDKGYINRYAIVLKPLQPFIDWINSLDPEEDPIDEIFEANIYLVNERIHDLDKWLKKNFDKFFITELNDWHENKKEWPQRRTYKMFSQWFSVNISTMIYDMEKIPVLKRD